MIYQTISNEHLITDVINPCKTEKPNSKYFGNSHFPIFPFSHFSHFCLHLLLFCSNFLNKGTGKMDYKWTTWQFLVILNDRRRFCWVTALLKYLYIDMSEKHVGTSILMTRIEMYTLGQMKSCCSYRLRIGYFLTLTIEKKNEKSQF